MHIAYKLQIHVIQEFYFDVLIFTVQGLKLNLHIENAPGPEPGNGANVLHSRFTRQTL